MSWMVWLRNRITKRARSQVKHTNSKFTIKKSVKSISQSCIKWTRWQMLRQKSRQLLSFLFLRIYLRENSQILCVKIGICTDLLRFKILIQSDYSNFMITTDQNQNSFWFLIFLRFLYTITWCLMIAFSLSSTVRLSLMHYWKKVKILLVLDVHVDSSQLMQHLHAHISAIIWNHPCMVLTVSHDVLAKRLCVLSRMTIMPDDFEICFSITVQNVANQDLK